MLELSNQHLDHGSLQAEVIACLFITFHLVKFCKRKFEFLHIMSCSVGKKEITQLRWRWETSGMVVPSCWNEVWQVSTLQPCAIYSASSYGQHEVNFAMASCFWWKTRRFLYCFASREFVDPINYLSSSWLGTDCNWYVRCFPFFNFTIVFAQDFDQVFLQACLESLL